MLWSKSEKIKFFENFSSFPNEIDKKEQIQIFYFLIINFLIPASRSQQHWRMEGAEPPAEYPRGYSVQKTTLLSRKLNELSESVSFDSEFTLAFEIQPLKIDFFFNAKFWNYSRAEWVK